MPATSFIGDIVVTIGFFRDTEGDGVRRARERR